MSAAGRVAAGERTRPPRYLHSARGSRYEARPGQTPVGERPGALLQVVLFVLAAALAAFTIVQGIAPHDEGLMLQAGARIASGEWPYRDFWSNYPPGQPLVLAVLQEIFGASLLVWRVVAVATDAAVALLAYRLAQRRAPEIYALGAWLAVAGVMAFPMLPGPNPPALLLAFAALVAARRRPGLAGVLAGLAVLFRVELGVAAIAGVLLSVPRGRRARALGPAVAVAVVSLAPFFVVAPHAMWHDLVGFYGIQDLQRLPFPIGFDGPWRPSKLIEFYIPLILVAGLVLWCVQMAVGRERRPVNARASMHGGIAAGPPAPGPDPEGWSLAPMAIVGLAYLLGRTDLYHLVPLAAVLPVMLTWTAAVARVMWLRVALLAALGLVAIYGVERRAGQALHPPAGAAVPGPAGDDVQTSPGDARALAALRNELAQITARGEPIFVTDPRTDRVTAGDPLLYVIAGHPNATRYDVMQPGVVTTASVQNEIVGSLRRAHTRVVVRWLDPRAEQPEPNGSSRSSGVHTLDDYLRSRYRPVARYGVYQVLLARDTSATP
jgi:hypothetical protein